VVETKPQRHLKMSEAPEIKLTVFPNFPPRDDDIPQNDPALWERIRVINYEAHFVKETDG
jgi:hypothetical protein